MTNRAAYIRTGRHNGKPVTGRGKYWLLFDNGDGTSTRSFVGAPLHKGNGPYSQADEIDTAWQTDTGAWQWKFDSADFLVNARGTFNVGDIFQFTDPASGEWVRFDPQSLNWIDENTSRQQIAIKQAVAAVANDYILSFPNGWGSGRHFRYEATPTRLGKVITIDSAANLPAPTVGGSQIWLEVEFSLATSTGVDIYLDGVLWTKPNNVRVQTAERIEFRDAATGSQILWMLDYPRAWDNRPGSNRETIGQFEVRRQGGPTALFITVRIPKVWIDSATFPINIDPTTVYSGAGDGYAKYGYGAWDTAHDAATGNTASYTGSSDLRAWTEYELATFYISRGFAPFDTSSIPDGDTISAATLYVTPQWTADDDGATYGWITVVSTTQASTSQVTTADYDQCGDAIDNPTEGVDAGDRMDITGKSVDTEYSFTLNATGQGWIDKTGTTKIGVRQGHDTTDNAIDSGSGDVYSGISFYTSEQGGTARDPQLDVTHASGGRTTYNTDSHPLGIHTGMAWRLNQP